MSATDIYTTEELKELIKTTLTNENKKGPKFNFIYKNLTLLRFVYNSNC